MKNKIVSLLIMLLLSTTAMTGLAHAQKSTREKAEIYLGDNIPLKLSSDAFIENGVTYMPFKDLFNELNMKVTYEPALKQVSAENEILSMKFTIGQPLVTINDHTEKAQPSIVENGIAYIPVNYLNKNGTKLSARKNSTNGILIEGRMIRKDILTYHGSYTGEGIMKGYGLVLLLMGKENFIEKVR